MAGSSSRILLTWLVKVHLCSPDSVGQPVGELKAMPFVTTSVLAPFVVRPGAAFESRPIASRFVRVTMPFVTNVFIYVDQPSTINQITPYGRHIPDMDCGTRRDTLRHRPSERSEFRARILRGRGDTRRQ